MTNLEAIQSTVAGYQPSANTFNRVLTDRGISATGVYSGKSAAFELATADIYMVLATAVNVSEGGFSVSISDRAVFKNMAAAIYDRYSDTVATGSANVIDRSSAW